MRVSSKACQNPWLLPWLCLVVLGFAPSPGRCRQGFVGGNGNLNNLLFPMGLPPFNSTEELLLRLEERRLEPEDGPAIGSNETFDGFDGEDASGNPVPANGCFICQGLEFLPENVPNYLYLPELVGATCQQWQYEILPLYFPTGDCPAQRFYQDMFVSCCRLPNPRYQCEQNIHNLLASDEDYNTAVPPIVSHEEPLTVLTSITYEYVEEIDVMAGTATVLITVGLFWKDPRLAWTVDDTNCANFIDMRTGYNDEDTKIWVPDFDVLAAKQGFQEFSATMATVSNDGYVSWYLSGPVTVMCVFHDLGNIPFDTLGCQFEFSGRSRVLNPNLIRYKLTDHNTIRVGLTEIQYSEFTPVPERFQQGYTWYFTSEDASAIYMNFYFQRAKNFYIWNILIPTIIFTYCSFCTFLLDMRVGERMGFGMALALVVVAAQIVTFEMIPTSSRQLWIDKFIAWSFYWVLFVLVQSVVVGFVYFLREDYEAKKTDRRLSNMSDGAREAMMENVAVFQDENGNETDENNDAAAADGTTQVRPPSLAVRPSLSDRLTGKSAKALGKEPWFIRLSARKFDYSCMLFCIVSYTIFVIVMFATNSGGAWVGKEGYWDSYDTLYGTRDFPNSVQDPNLQAVS